MLGVEIKSGWSNGNAESMLPFWHAYRQNGDPALREQLIEHYLPFARMLAAKTYANRIQAELEFSDYLQFASVGLIESVDRFDPAITPRFEAFSALRINGAILNGIVSLSEKHEQISARKHLLADRAKALKSEMAKPKPKDTEAVFSYLAELAIGLAVGFALEGTGMYQQEEESYEESVYGSIELKHLYKKVAELLECLPDKERRVIKLHYLQQIPFEEIAGMFGLSKGRISQIHKSALERLKAGFGSNLDFRC
ncbi:MAG TPA: sigma-70 family RNA polymerase sigma factor [Noviherbaspirillum sp.]